MAIMMNADEYLFGIYGAQYENKRWKLRFFNIKKD